MRAAGRFVARFYWKAYRDNLTGLSAMVAYNMLLSILPLALLALFIAGQVLKSSDLEASVLRDLHRIFPTAADRTLTSALRQVQNNSGGFGIAALIASIWIGSSFWGALETAFSRIYGVEGRSWLHQKRFAVVMLVVVLLFMAATVAVPTLQSVLASGADRLPLGLSGVRTVVFVATLLLGVLLLFLVLCVIYRTVPNEPLPWGAIWPGALAATVAISAVDYAFPFYLSHVSTLSEFGTTLVFVLIVLVWFYVLAIIILGGATINAMHFDDMLARQGHGQPTPAAAMAAAAGPTGANPTSAAPEPRGGSA
jgi:YihY family inner membrane protein